MGCAGNPTSTASTTAAHAVAGSKGSLCDGAWRGTGNICQVY